MFQLDATGCAKAQRPERAGTVEDQKQALQCSKLGWGEASETQGWEKKQELRTEEGF